MSSVTGEAPCKCGWYITDVRLTGYMEFDGNGGWNWECKPGQVCPSCGEPLHWLHEPSQENLTILIRKFQKVEVK